LCESIARDLNAGPDDIRPRIAAAALIAAFGAIRDRDRDPAALGSNAAENPMAVLDDVLGFLRGGLDALSHDHESRPSSASA
jgi:hypothetical protein